MAIPLQPAIPPCDWDFVADSADSVPGGRFETGAPCSNGFGAIPEFPPSSFNSNMMGSDMYAFLGQANTELELANRATTDSLLYTEAARFQGQWEGFGQSHGHWAGVGDLDREVVYIESAPTHTDYGGDLDGWSPSSYDSPLTMTSHVSSDNSSPIEPRYDGGLLAAPMSHPPVAGCGGFQVTDFKEQHGGLPPTVMRQSNIHSHFKIQSDQNPCHDSTWDRVTDPGWTAPKVGPPPVPLRVNRARVEKDEQNDFLVRSRLAGMSYGDIKKKGNFAEAESTLRGRFRILTKDKSQRLRRPAWKEKDIQLLRNAITFYTKPINCRIEVNPSKVPWKKVSQFIVDNGGSYQFGYATCKKKWLELEKRG